MSGEAVPTKGVVSVLNNPTVEKLKDMKLKVMAEMLANPDPTLRELSFEERLGLMVEKEWIARKNARIKRLLKNASLGVDACIEDIDYSAGRTIDKKTIQVLSTCAFMEQKTTPAVRGIPSNTTGCRNSSWKSRTLKTTTDTQNLSTNYRRSSC